MTRHLNVIFKGLCPLVQPQHWGLVQVSLWAQLCQRYLCWCPALRYPATAPPRTIAEGLSCCGNVMSPHWRWTFSAQGTAHIPTLPRAPYLPTKCAHALVSSAQSAYQPRREPARPRLGPGFSPNGLNMSAMCSRFLGVSFIFWVGAICWKTYIASILPHSTACFTAFLTNSQYTHAHMYIVYILSLRSFVCCRHIGIEFISVWWLHV